MLPCNIGSSKDTLWSPCTIGKRRYPHRRHESRPVDKSNVSEYQYNGYSVLEHLCDVILSYVISCPTCCVVSQCNGPICIASPQRNKRRQSVFCDWHTDGHTHTDTYIDTQTYTHAETHRHTQSQTHIQTHNKFPPKFSPLCNININVPLFLIQHDETKTQEGAGCLYLEVLALALDGD